MAADASQRYVALYPEAILYLTRLADLEALSILIALCDHADAFGCCDPGPRLLGVKTGHRRDRIPDILERLQVMDYIHIIEITVPFRQRPIRGFQINPYVIRLRADHHASAVADWQGFNPQTKGHYEKPTSVIMHGENDHQPDQNQNQDQNQHHNQSHNPLQELPTNQRSASAAAPFATPGASGADQARFEGVGQKPQPEQGESPRPEAASDASASPPSAAAPPREPKDLVHFRHPLAQDDRENLALDLVNLAGDMSRENARMLVETYGAERVGVVIQLFYQQKAVASPARWIRSMLRKTDVELWKARKIYG